MDFSEYDPRVAFDDLVGAPFGAFGGGGVLGGMVQRARRGIADAARALLGRAHQRRRIGPTRVIGGVADTTMRSFFAGIEYEVLGDDEPPPSGLPVYDALYRQISDRLPEPKLARVDDVDSYAEFRAARRAPYLASLEARLAAVEAGLAEHTADRHGGGRVEALEDALRKHIEECVCGGEPIALPIEAAQTGEIECWQDGPEILVTIRVPCVDGQTRMVTSGTPVAEQAEEVVGCALEADVDPDELLAVGPSVMQLVGAARLVDQVRLVSDAAIECCEGAPGTVALVPAADPTMAAAMALLQRCQMGDWAACTDARRMLRSHAGLMSQAAERLLYAQRVSRGGMS